MYYPLKEKSLKDPIAGAQRCHCLEALLLIFFPPRCLPFMECPKLVQLVIMLSLPCTIEHLWRVHNKFLFGSLWLSRYIYLALLGKKLSLTTHSKTLKQPFYFMFLLGGWVSEWLDDILQVFISENFYVSKIWFLKYFYF